MAGKTHFSEIEKQEVLAMLKDYPNLNKASKTLGIARSTLMKWQEEIGERKDLPMKVKRERKRAVETGVSTLSERFTAQIEKNQMKFLDDVFTVKKDALAKMQHLIKFSNSLKDVTGALDILHKISHIEGQGDPLSDDAEALFNKIMKIQPVKYEEVID